MTIIAVAGDRCSTTALALAASWPAGDDVLLVEADPSGGDLAAWFDLPVTPSLSTVVTRARDGDWPEIERHVRRTDAGVRLIPSPASAGEAAQAVGESAGSIVPTLADLQTQIVIADTGRLTSATPAHPFVAEATVTVLVHRQADQSARAAAVRLQRLTEQIDGFGSSPTTLIVAMVGTSPFGLSEIAQFVAEANGDTEVVSLPDDPLAAAVLGGRTGVSSRRLVRLPLMRAARGLATIVHRTVTESAAAPREAAQ